MKKLLIVLNNADWPSLPLKVQGIKDFYSPAFALQIDTAKTSFAAVPLITGQTLEGINNTPVVSHNVDPEWYATNILPLAAGYDFVILNVPVLPTDLFEKLGIEFGKRNGTYQIAMCIPETFTTSVNEKIWDMFVLTACHEISHAIYAELGKADMTHAYFLGGSPYDVLKDFNARGDSRTNIDLLQTLRDLLIRVYNVTVAHNPHASTGDSLIDALIKVESKGNDYAVGDVNLPDKAYGCLQVRKPCIDDVNAANGTNYRAESMLGNRALSVWAFNRYMDLYATAQNLGHVATNEDRARIWNGGPNGWKSPSTEGYWQAVSKLLAS